MRLYTFHEIHTKESIDQTWFRCSFWGAALNMLWAFLRVKGIGKVLETRILETNKISGLFFCLFQFVVSCTIWNKLTYPLKMGHPKRTCHLPTIDWFVRDGKSETPIYDLLTNLYSPQKSWAPSDHALVFCIRCVIRSDGPLTKNPTQKTKKSSRNHLKTVWGFHQALQFFWQKARNDSITIKLSSIYISRWKPCSALRIILLHPPHHHQLFHHRPPTYASYSPNVLPNYISSPNTHTLHIQFPTCYIPCYTPSSPPYVKPSNSYSCP